jgi:hypothetical protein
VTERHGGIERHVSVPGRDPAQELAKPYTYGTTRRNIVIPAKVLAGELEFAIAYLAACNRNRDLLGEDRKAFAEGIVALLFERAGEELSGMRIVPGERLASQG